MYPLFDVNKFISFTLGKNRKTQMYWAAVYWKHCTIIIIVTSVMMMIMFTSPLTEV